MNFLADGQTTKKVKIIPITKSLFFGRVVLLLWLLLVVEVPFSSIKNLMLVEFSADGRFTGTRTQEGGCVGVGGGGGLKVDFGGGCSGGRHDSGPGPRLLHLDVGLGVAAAGLVTRVRVAALALQAALGGRS